MVGFGAYLLVSVAAAAPAHADKLASMYEDAACDPSEGGECAVEPDLSLPQATAILDCQSPLLHDMIGSCDNPKPALPALHVATLRTGGAIGATRTPTGERLTVVTSTLTVDAALPFCAPTLTPIALASALAERSEVVVVDGPHARLERPPRA